MTHFWEARFNVGLDKEACLLKAESVCDDLQRLAPNISLAHVLRCGVSFLRGRHDEAEAHCMRAIDLAPSDASARAWKGMVSVYAGKDRQALAELQTALRYSPLAPSWFVYYQCWASLWLEDFGAARKHGEAYLAMEPEEPFSYVTLAVLAAFEERETEAKALITRLHEKAPAFGLADVERSQIYKNPDRYDRVITALRRAGLL